VLLGRVERAEAERAGDLVARGRRAALGERLADELEDLELAGREQEEGGGSSNAGSSGGLNRAKESS
jgi:hypothetical protein